MRVTTRALAAAALAGVAALHGCAGAPPPGTPVSGAALAELAARLSAPSARVEALRGSGHGTARLSNREVSFAFTLVYDNPGWLRADVRPELGSLSGTMTALLLWEADCGRCYLPAKGVEIRGCLPEEGVTLSGIDQASLLLGAPQSSLIDQLTDACVAMEDDSIVIRGRRDEATMRASFEGDPPRLRELVVREGLSELTLTYEGHGWKKLPWLPETTVVTLLRRGKRELSATLQFRTLRQVEHVERRDYDIHVPPGARIVGWEDLKLWRSE